MRGLSRRRLRRGCVRFLVNVGDRFVLDWRYRWLLSKGLRAVEDVSYGKQAGGGCQQVDEAEDEGNSRGSSEGGIFEMAEDGRKFALRLSIELSRVRLGRIGLKNTGLMNADFGNIRLAEGRLSKASAFFLPPPEPVRDGAGFTPFFGEAVYPGLKYIRCVLVGCADRLSCDVTDPHREHEDHTEKYFSADQRRRRYLCGEQTSLNEKEAAHQKSFIGEQPTEAVVDEIVFMDYEAAQLAPVFQLRTGTHLLAAA